MTLRLLFILTLIGLIFSSCQGKKPANKAISKVKTEPIKQDPVNKQLAASPEKKDKVEGKPVKTGLPIQPEKGKTEVVQPKPVKVDPEEKKPAEQPAVEIPTKAPPVAEPDKVEPADPPVTSTPPVAEPATPSETKPTSETKPVPVPAPPFNHELWDVLLQKYVSATGKVNYKGFKTDQAKLDKYLVALQENTPDASWRRAEAMSYWLNVYNAFTIKLIIDNYPVKSIQDIAGGKPWDKEWIKLGGKTYSLNHVENKIIRPTYKDARIHFAVNCAAKSCPTLYNHAFTPEKLERQLAQLTKTFINNKMFNQIAGDKAVVSKIFEWYAVDFGDLKSFLNKFSAVKIGDGVTIGFNEYDWGLNE